MTSDARLSGGPVVTFAVTIQNNCTTMVGTASTTGNTKQWSLT